MPSVWVCWCECSLMNRPSSGSSRKVKVKLLRAFQLMNDCPCNRGCLIRNGSNDCYNVNKMSTRLHTHHTAIVPRVIICPLLFTGKIIGQTLKLLKNTIIEDDRLKCSQPIQFTQISVMKSGVEHTRTKVLRESQPTHLHEH